eukprot:sb/3476880/
MFTAVSIHTQILTHTLISTLSTIILTVGPRSTRRINFPRLRKLTVFDPDIPGTPILKGCMAAPTRSESTVASKLGLAPPDSPTARNIAVPVTGNTGNINSSINDGSHYHFISF